MDNWEDQIWAFGELSPEAQARVVAYVAAHPEWRPKLCAAQRMHALLAEAGRVDGLPPGQDVLAFYVATEYYSAAPPQQPWVQNIEAAIRDDPEVRARYQTLQAELAQRVQATDADPVARFEKLTGHRLEPRPEDASSTL